MKNLSVLILFAGLELRVYKNDAGDDVTPLKPISDLFGLKWEKQRLKVTESTILREQLGTCTLLVGGADGQNRLQTCITLEGVFGYLMGISSERMFANGNPEGAKNLNAKIKEWQIALRDYEVHGEAINQNHIKHREALRRDRMALMSMYNTKNATRDADDRTQITRVIRQASAELGLPYQSDLLDGGND